MSKILNLLTFAGLAAAAYAAITGKDFTGMPTSTATMDCGVIAGEFVGDQMEIEHTLRKVLRIDALKTLRHDSQKFVCLGLAFLEGSPSTYVRLSSIEKSAGQFDLRLDQALPTDYTCDLLADEIVMKFSGRTVGGIGVIRKITDITTQDSLEPLDCWGVAQFDNGIMLPVVYSYDGKEFRVSL